MCLESLAKMLLGRRRVIKLRKTWRFKQTADDKICLLKDQDVDTEIHVDENTRKDQERTDNGFNSYDFPRHIPNKCEELGLNERSVKCNHAKTIDGYEIIHLRYNDTRLENGDARSEETRAQNLVNNGRKTDTVTSQNSKDPIDNETFFNKHLYLLTQTSRSLSQKSNKETDKATQGSEYELNNSPSEELSKFANCVEMQFQTLEERCRYYWNTNSDSDEESDLDENDNDRTCDSLSELDDTFLDTESDCHDTNGVTEVSIHEEDLGINHLNKSLGDADNSFGYASLEVTDVSYSSDSEDSFADTSDCEIGINSL